MKRIRVLEVACGALCIAAGACKVEKVQFADSAAGELAQAPAAQSCGVIAQTALTGDGIGDLRIGRPLSVASQHCVVVSHPVVALGGSDSAQIVHVDLIRDTVEAMVVHDTIRRIQVSDSAFLTSDHFGVDTRVAKLLTLPDVEGRTVGGSLWVISPSHCGLAFRLEGPAPTPPAAQSGKAALRRLAGEERVDRVSILGCTATS